jgi:hypothetical protein
LLAFEVASGGGRIVDAGVSDSPPTMHLPAAESMDRVGADYVRVDEYTSGISLPRDPTGRLRTRGRVAGYLVLGANDSRGAVQGCADNSSGNSEGIVCKSQLAWAPRSTGSCPSPLT